MEPIDHTIQNSLTLMRSSPQSLEASKTATGYSASTNTLPSAFHGCPPATKQQATLLIAQFSQCFPQMPQNFWTMLASMVEQEQISAERLQYMIATFVKTYHYPTFTIADFLAVDKTVSLLTAEDIENISLPHEPIVQFKHGDKYYYTFESQARQAGFAYRRWLSRAELKAKDQQQEQQKRVAFTEYQQELIQDTTMITGFEQQTAELNDYELSTLVPIVTAGLKTKVGKDNACTNRYIVDTLSKKGYQLTDSRLRKVINYIRVNDIVPCLIATSSGYYISYDKQELNDYIQSLLSREQAIAQVRVSIQNQMKQQI